MNDWKEISYKNCKKWLDLGSNIGTFAIKAANSGCEVIAYEPEPDNFEILLQNTQDLNVTPIKAGVMNTINAPNVPLYICKGEYNKYRHTVFKVRGRRSIDIEVHAFADVLDQYKPDGVKIDIEGAEIDILDSMDVWPSYVNQLVFEYSFDRDSSIKRFVGIIDKLKNNFDEVYHPKFDLTREKYEFYPPAVIVYAKRNSPSNNKT